jgi:hypothetical protein
MEERKQIVGIPSNDPVFGKAKSNEVAQATKIGCFQRLETVKRSILDVQVWAQTSLMDRVWDESVNPEQFTDRRISR